MAVKQLAAKQTIETSQRVVAQRQIAQRIAGGSGFSSTNSIMQRQVIDGSKSYSGEKIYQRYSDAFDNAGVTEEDLIEYVDDNDDITKAELFRLFKVKTKRVLEEDACDEEIKAGKEKTRTSAPVSKHRKLYNTTTFRCQEPTCFHTSRTITLNSDGTEHGYANKHGRLQAPPVAHDKDAPANIRISAFEEVVREMLKKRNRSYDSIKLNSRYKAIRKRVEWTGSLGTHHQSHTRCNLKNKDITWKSLAENRKKKMRTKVKDYLARKRFMKELNTL